MKSCARSPDARTTVADSKTGRAAWSKTSRVTGSDPIFQIEKMGLSPFGRDARSRFEELGRVANAPGCDFPIRTAVRHLQARIEGGAAWPASPSATRSDLAALGVKSGPTLNGLAGDGRPTWKKLRKEISKALVKKRDVLKTPRTNEAAQLFLRDGRDYTDFYTRVHATTSAGCSAPTTRCCPTTSGCRSATTARSSVWSRALP